MAWFECSASLPPRRMHALPDLRHSAARIGRHVGARLVDDARSRPAARACGPTWMPEGRERRSVISPTGSGSARHLAQALGHRLDRLRGEREAVDEGVVVARRRARPSRRARWRRGSVFSRSTRASAASSSARFFAPVEARASARGSRRGARSPIASIVAARSSVAHGGARSLRPWSAAASASVAGTGLPARPEGQVERRSPTDRPSRRL